MTLFRRAVGGLRGELDELETVKGEMRLPLLDAIDGLPWGRGAPAAWIGSRTRRGRRVPRSSRAARDIDVSRFRAAEIFGVERAVGIQPLAVSESDSRLPGESAQPQPDEA